MIISYHKQIETFIDGLLEKDLSSLPLWKRTPLRASQILYASVRDIADGQLSLQAMSLVYSTLIAIVPLLAISFSVLKGFGVHNQIEPFLLNVLQPLGPEQAQEVSGNVINFVDNIQVSVLGVVGFALLIYAVISLMQKIEGAFNYIWRVGQDRTFAQRFSDYLSVLLMGPLLIFLSAGLTTTAWLHPEIQKLRDIGEIGTLFEFTSWLIPWIVMAVGFTFVYVYMPNTKVRLKAAFAGALVTALMWKTVGFVFSSVIASSANYVAIYAAFATLIILMIWLYAAWLIVLIGANVSFYAQYPRYVRVGREDLVLSPRLTLTLGLSALTLITRNHYNNKTPLNAEIISKNLNVPIIAVQRVMSLLQAGGIITTSNEERGHYFPACPFDETPIEKVISALEEQGRKGWHQTNKMRIPAEANTILNTVLEARSIKTQRSIKETLLSEKV